MTALKAATRPPRPNLFSQHSSNPLEVGSSDPRNNLYLKRYNDTRLNNPASSDDPLDGYEMPEVEDYHHHLTTIIPDYKIPHAPRAHDDEQAMDSDDEMNRANEDERDPFDDDEDMDMQDESDEELSIMKKSPQEQQEIEEEIAEVERAVPDLCQDYRLVDRLGTGTFSSVYKAVDLGYHSKWDNTPWLGSHPPNSSAHYQSVPHPRGTKVFVAIKRIYVTSNPERIRNEIAILVDCRGCRHVSQLITAYRHEDQVVAIMPYHRNDDFRDYYRTLSMAGIKAFFRCLFRALRDIHSRKIIHRDVKPANFLFDPRTGQGTLCDFGLACRLDSGPKQTHGACFHTPATPEYPHGRAISRNDYDVERFRERQRDALNKSKGPTEKVGYLANDTRPVSKANRAGTRGFRAPEVLLKCSEQTGAIDVWAAGIILLFFLTGKFPLFQCSDDNEALMEIAVILGRKKMEKTAKLHSRTFATNVPTVNEESVPWKDFVTRQNLDLYNPPPQDPAQYPYYTNDNEFEMHANTDSFPPASSSSPSRGPSSPGSTDLTTTTKEDMAREAHRLDVELAFSLLEGLLEPDACKRMTPKEALAHKFLHDGGPDDDEMFPHPFGKGVCKDYHSIDSVTEEPMVLVYEPLEPGQTKPRLATKSVMPGQGIAIGRQPCEFHKDTTLYG